MIENTVDFFRDIMQFLIIAVSNYSACLQNPPFWR